MFIVVISYSNNTLVSDDNDADDDDSDADDDRMMITMLKNMIEGKV